MNRKIILSILLIIGLISVSFGASLRLDSITTTPGVIKPGDEVDLILRIQNIVSQYEDPKYSYILEISPKGIISNQNIIIIDGENNLGRLGANEYWNSKFKIKVKEGAPSSTYELNVQIKKYLEGVLIGITDASIDFNVLGETFFRLDSKDKTIQQGEIKTFNAQISNIGGSNAGSVKVSFENTNQLQVVGTNSFYFNSINNNEKQDFEITIFAANNLASGTYVIPVTITYNDGTTQKIQSIDVGVVVGGNIDLKVSGIETSPKEIRPGDNYVLVSFNLQNSGFDAAKAITAVLETKDFKSSYSNNNNVYVGRIDANSYSNLKFYIDIPKDVKSGVYNVNLDVEYLNLIGDDFNKTIAVPIYIKEKPVLEIKNFEATSKAGQTMRVKIDVENQGEENAQEVDIRLISDSSHPFTIEERSAYIGSINAGETKTAIFNVVVSRDADINDYNVRAFIRARGDSEIGNNNIYTYNKDVNLSVTGKALNKLAIGGFAVALLAIFAMLFRRKKSFKAN